MPFKKSLLKLIAFTLCVSSCKECNQAVEDLSAQRKLHHTISILNINLRDCYDVPCNDASGSWDKRIDRMTTWIRNNNYPDIIAIQEANAWLWRGLEGGDLKDYQVLFRIIDSLNIDAKHNYRIAYLANLEENGGIGDCSCGGAGTRGNRLKGGKALIYNANKLLNTTLQKAKLVGSATEDYSLAACNLALGSQRLVSLIDGAATIRNGCSAATPLGSTIKGPHTAFSIFQLKDTTLGNPGELHIYNVHGPRFDNTISQANMFNFIAAMVTANQDNKCMFPPVILGDFNINLEVGNSSYNSRFDTRTYHSRDKIIGMLMPKLDTFNLNLHYSKFTDTSLHLMVNGDDAVDPALGVWTDHDAIFHTLIPN